MTDRAATDERMMRLALEQAAAAAAHGDVPIGAVVARGEEVLAAAGNERELRSDPTAHAEVLALRAAAERLGGWRLPDTTLYVTLEPCAMCAGAISLARVPRVLYAAPDTKGGALGGVVDLYGRPAGAVLNHRPEVAGGLLAAEAGALLRDFFASRRGATPGGPRSGL
ncbi:MAG: nucleoside deaminase [Solirubrobacterales bacterium]